MVVIDLNGDVYYNIFEDFCKLFFIRMLKLFEDFLMWFLLMVLNDKIVFDIIDEDYIKFSVSVVVKVNVLLYVVLFCEDEVKVGLVLLLVLGSNLMFQ